MADGHSIIGVDLGGTKLAAARYGTDWLEQDSSRVDTEANAGFEHVYTVLLNQINDLRTADTTAVGIGVPGLVAQPAGTVLNAPNIPGFTDVPLRTRLEADTGLVVAIDNDANCFALAEALHGAGKEHDVVVAVTLGTGVGGGIIINQQVYHGATGYAAEFGHMLLQPGKPPYDTTDQRGDVEQFLSGTAMGRRCAAADNPEQYLSGDVCAFMRPELFQEVAWLCTNLIHVLDPSVIIFGGSAGRALADHLPTIADELQNWLLPATPVPTLKVAALDDAACRGAALLCS